MDSQAKLAADTLRKMANFKQMLAFPYETGKIINECADLIESLSAQLDQVTRERDAAKDINVPTQPKWISVKERLPEDGAKVIAVGLYGNIHTAIHLYENTYEREDVPGDYGYFSATHWMPLPSTEGLNDT